MLLDIFLGEFLGTMFLIILGNGVVANCVFKKTIGAKSGFLAITFGWAIAVFVGVLIANAFNTGGHLNPAVTVMQWVKGNLSWDKALIYFASEFSGALFGQIIISIFYLNHINDFENKNEILSMHSTGPTHKNYFSNLFSEFIGTAVLVSCAMVLGLSMNSSDPTMNSIMKFAGPLSMGIVVLGIGISLGGTTGYAINPCRDLMPRIVYTIAPYKNKPLNSANWGYAFVPVLGPLCAGVIVGAFGRLI
ncbi:MAG: aquaporin family protein [Mycoplasmatales bacterium]|nr:aquaporin family protein [Mycoplasmatales bacterium]